MQVRIDVYVHFADELKAFAALTEQLRAGNDRLAQAVNCLSRATAPPERRDDGEATTAGGNEQ